LLCREEGSTDIEKPSGVVLDPLAEVGIGVLMSIVISRRQLMVDVLRHGKRGNGKHEYDEADRYRTPKQAGQR